MYNGIIPLSVSMTELIIYLFMKTRKRTTFFYLFTKTRKCTTFFYLFTKTKKRTTFFYLFMKTSKRTTFFYLFTKTRKCTFFLFVYEDKKTHNIFLFVYEDKTMHNISLFTNLSIQTSNSKCIITVKPVLGGHTWGMSKVTSQERWPLKRGSVKTDQSCHQMDCQALSRNTFCACIYRCKWT